MSNSTATQWTEALQSLSPHVPEKVEGTTTFRGIGGSVQSDHVIKWPTRLGQRGQGVLGHVSTSILPGQCPPLLSANALANMGGILRLSEPPSLTLEKLGLEVPLRRHRNGHLILDVIYGFRTTPLYPTTSSTSSAAADSSATTVRSKSKPKLNQTPKSNTQLPNTPQPRVAFTARSEVSLGVLSEVRKLARDTKGPWVHQQHLDRVEMLVEGLVGSYAVQILAANIAYKPKITRRPPAQMIGACTHVYCLAVDSSGEIVLLQKQWKAYSDKGPRELKERYPLMLTVFAKIEPITDNARVSQQWIPNRRKADEHSAMMVNLSSSDPTSESGSIERLDSLAPPPGLDPPSSSHAIGSQGQVPQPRRESSSGATLHERAADSGRQPAHDLVGLPPVRPSCLRDSYGQEPSVLRCAGMPSVQGLGPPVPAAVAGRAQEVQGATALQGRTEVPRGQGGSGLLGRRGGNSERRPQDPEAERGCKQQQRGCAYSVQVLCPSSSTGAGQAPAATASTSDAGNSGHQEGDARGGHGVRDGARHSADGGDQCARRSCCSTEDEHGIQGASQALSAVPDVVIGPEFSVDAEVFQKSLRQGKLPGWAYTEQAFTSTSIDPVYTKVLVTKSELQAFLGPKQQHLLDQDVWLIEMFAGLDPELSKAAERSGKYAIRLGLAHGQDFNRARDRALAIELVKYTMPEHVHISWQCTSVAGFSELNREKGGPDYIKRNDEDRRRVGDWCNMFGDVYLVQYYSGRFCHGENPEGSLAWLHPRFATLPGLLWTVTDQCPYNLRSIRPPHKLLKKATGIVTNSEYVQHHFPR